MERNSLLPSMPSRGHGLVLLIFWLLVFIAQNLNFLIVIKEDWWIQLHKLVNHFEYTFNLTILRVITIVINFQHKWSN